MTSAMLECTLCRMRRSQLLSEQQLNALHGTGCAQFYCDTCRNNTFWCYAQYDRRSGRDRRIGFPDPIAEQEEPSRHFSDGRMPGLEPLAGGIEEDAARPSRPSPPPVPRSPDDRRADHQRGHRRIALGLPVLVRVPGHPGFDERTSTINVCKGGIYIQSEKPYQKDMTCFVILNYTEPAAGSSLEQRARVVRIDLNPARPKKGVAIAFN